MWTLVRTAAVWVFGDDIVKLVLYVVVGLFVVGFIEASAATQSIMAQPFGQWWLAGVSGGVGKSPQPVAARSAPTVSQAVAAPTPAVGLPPASFDRITTLVTNAMAWLGVRYRWGGCARDGIDCSCLMQNAFRTIGVNLPRTTVEQIRVARPISSSSAAAGDLVFFDDTCTGCGANPTHVGLVLGDGRMIDAGDPVRIEPIYSGHNARYGRVL